jgi:lysophospholipase L1-like esterase
VEVDGASNMTYIKLTAVNDYQTVKLATGLAAGKHTIRVYKATDARNDVLRISSVKFTGQLLKTPVASRRIEFLGDSITAAACIFDNAKPSQLADYHTYGMTASWHGYAKKTADALGASHYSVAIGGWKLCYSTNPHISIRSIYPYVSMHSKTTMGPYDFDYNPDVVVINLGTNDWAESQATYQKDALELLQLVREKNPNATIVWAYGMMDEDHPSVNWIRDTVNQFNATDKNAYFIAMRENKNGLWAHPDKEAHIQAGNTLAAFIKDIKGW